MQVTLINRSGIVIKTNDFVKINPADPDHLSFLFANYWEAEVMGTASHNCAPGKKCIINLINTINGGPITAAPASLGISPNYSYFDTTGHQSMFGNARPWRDETNDALTIQKNGVGITANIQESTVDFDFNAAYNANYLLADFLYKNIQLNHDKDLASSIYPHIHWFQAKNYSPNFLFAYRWQINGGAKVTPWTLIVANILAHPYIGSEMHQISHSAPIVVPPGTTLSDGVQFRIYRDTGNVSGLFAGVCPYNTGGNASTPVLFFDVHFMLNSIGSTDEYTK